MNSAIDFTSHGSRGSSADRGSPTPLNELVVEILGKATVDTKGSVTSHLLTTVTHRPSELVPRGPPSHDDTALSEIWFVLWLYRLRYAGDIERGSLFWPTENMLYLG